MKVCELSGALLDFWAAKAEGNYRYVTPDLLPHYEFPPYSSDWARGGPIVEREKISIGAPIDPAHCTSTFRDENLWQATSYNRCLAQCGNTPLEAAMRCFVASRFGEEVADA